jgi:hypothetical protein
MKKETIEEKTDKELFLRNILQGAVEYYKIYWEKDSIRLYNKSYIPLKADY